MYRSSRSTRSDWSRCRFQITLPLLHKGLYAILYGDLIMLPAQSVPPLRNRSRHGRGTRGRVEHPSGGEMTSGRLRYRDVKATYRRIIADFAAIDGVGARRTAPQTQSWASWARYSSNSPRWATTSWKSF